MWVLDGGSWISQLIVAGVIAPITDQLTSFKNQLGAY